jgi:hypothetical protein
MRLHEKELAIHLQGLISEIMEVMGLTIDTFITRKTLSDPSLRKHLFLIHGLYTFYGP